MEQQQCPICMLYLLPGMNLQDHLDTRMCQQLVLPTYQKPLFEGIIQVGKRFIAH